MRSGCVRQGDPKPRVGYPPGRHTREGGRPHKAEGADPAMRPQAKDAPGPPEAGGRGLQRERGPASTLLPARGFQSCKGRRRCGFTPPSLWHLLWQLGLIQSPRSCKMPAQKYPTPRRKRPQMMDQCEGECKGSRVSRSSHVLSLPTSVASLAAGTFL